MLQYSYQSMVYPLKNRKKKIRTSKNNYLKNNNNNNFQNGYNFKLQIKFKFI